MNQINSLQRRGYFLGDMIGKGTFSKVVKARHDKDGKRIDLACKIIDKKKALSNFVTDFFPRELDVLSKLNHPYLIGIYSILERNDIVYVFMRWAEEGDLLKYIKKNRCPNESQANLWFSQMVCAIKYLHGLDYAHRDIKLENILLSKNLNVKIGDFGFTRLCVDEDKKPILSSTFCGSQAYAAPEILMNQPYHPKKVDVWALGVTLFVMLCGEMPYDDSNCAKRFKDQKARKFRETNALQTLSHSCMDMINELLEFDPELRPDIESVCAMGWLSTRMSRK